MSERAGEGAGESESAPTGIRDVLDERMVAAVERWMSGPVEPLPPLPQIVREPRRLLDPADWNTGFLAVHERELPADLFSDLKEVTPQALLRDLHRPNWVEEPIEREPLETTAKVHVEEARAVIRDALLERRVMPEITRSSVYMVEHNEWRRELFASKWTAYLDDEEPRRDIYI